VTRVDPPWPPVINAAPPARLPQDRIVGLATIAISSIVILLLVALFLAMTHGTVGEAVYGG